VRVWARAPVSFGPVWFASRGLHLEIHDVRLGRS
jgi:hypothetical protein